MSYTTNIENKLNVATFGDLLRHLRLSVGLTQQQLGAAVGYSRAHIARLENGQRLPAISAVKTRFPKALDLTSQPELVSRLISLAEAANALTPHAVFACLPNNLPSSVTRFFGHERSLAHVMRLLESNRLVTVTGTGGTGKTRLALELAIRLKLSAGKSDQFVDGIWQIELAQVTDPGLVALTILVALGLPMRRDAAPRDSLIAQLREKKLLLILDNCEHLIDACTQVADALLHGCAGVRVLATSREPLDLPGELVWRVPSLQVPDRLQPLSPAQLHRFDAVRLFVDRAQLASPGFALAANNVSAVQQICARLDGIPLALELAAARLRTMTVQEIAQHLDDRFRLLISGNRTALARHQTMRAEIDWSYDLLTEGERACLRHLAVFAGTWTAEAASAICRCDDRIDANEPDILSRLADKSLVVESVFGDATRFRLLETIRQYAMQKLVEADELNAARSRHLAYYAAFGEREWPVLSGSVSGDQATLLNRLELDLDNFRQAIRWAIDCGEIDMGLRLLNRVLDLFVVRAGQQEVMSAFAALLRHPAAVHRTRAEAEAYLNLGDLHLRQNEVAAADDALDKAEALSAALNELDLLASMLLKRAFSAVFRNDYALARSHLSAWRTMATENHLYDPETLLEIDSSSTGMIALLAGDAQEAKSCYQQVCESERRRQRGKVSTSAMARHLGYALIQTGELRMAADCIRESLLDNQALGDAQAVAACLSACACLALARADQQTSAMLFGASKSIQSSIHTPLMTTDAIMAERSIAKLRQRANPADLEIAWSDGARLSVAKAVALAVSTVSAGADPHHATRSEAP